MDCSVKLMNYQDRSTLRKIQEQWILAEEVTSIEKTILAEVKCVNFKELFGVICLILLGIFELAILVL